MRELSLRNDKLNVTVLRPPDFSLQLSEKPFVREAVGRGTINLIFYISVILKIYFYFYLDSFVNRERFILCTYLSSSASQDNVVLKKV